MSEPSIVRSPAGVLTRRRTEPPERPSTSLCVGAQHDVDAILLEDGVHGRGYIGILPAEQLRPELQYRHLAPEPPERLRELHPHVSAAEHDQVRRQPVELECLDMGERLSVGKAGDTRDGRARAEIQEQVIGDEAARSAFRKPRLDRARPHEVAVGEKELEIRDRELLAVDRNHAVDHFAFALADANHVHCRTLDATP